MAQLNTSNKANEQLDELAKKAKDNGELLKFKQDIANKAIDQYYKRNINK